MVNDRGSIKWTTMMLPEHAELLRKLWQEDKRVKKPQLDMQQIERMDSELLVALQDNLFIELTVYNSSSLQKISGVIMKLDEHNKCIHLKRKDDAEVVQVPFHLVTDISIK